VRLRGRELEGNVNDVLFAVPRMVFFPDSHQVSERRRLIDAAYLPEGGLMGAEVIF
jgi:hypothetical protein